MMMPANYSVVAENEMTYVVGGGIADILAPMMTAKNVQNIVVNTISMVGSFFVDNLVGKSLHAIFTTGFTNETTIGSALKNVWNGTMLGVSEDNILGSIGNVLLDTVAVASAIYTMGMSQIGPKFSGYIKATY